MNSGPLSVVMEAGSAARCGELIEDGDDGGAADGGIDVKRQALAGEVIDQREAAEAATAGELVMDEVHAPALVGSGWLRQRDASDGREFAAVFATQGKALLTINALGALVILDQPLGLEDIVKDRRTPARLEGRPMAQPLAQSGVIASGWLVLQAGTVPAGEATEAALREPKAGEDLVHGGSAGLGL